MLAARPIPLYQGATKALWVQTSMLAATPILMHVSSPHNIPACLYYGIRRATVIGRCSSYSSSHYTLKAVGRSSSYSIVATTP